LAMMRRAYAAVIPGNRCSWSAVATLRSIGDVLRAGDDERGFWPLETAQADNDGSTRATHAIATRCLTTQPSYAESTSNAACRLYSGVRPSC
jgi:hypothetical protein